MKKEISKKNGSSKTLNALKFIGKIKPKIRVTASSASVTNISIA